MYAIRSYYAGEREQEGDHAAAVVGFRTERGERITARVASSFISPRQALLNLERETGGHDFNAIRDAAHEKWTRELGRIKVA